MRWLWLGLASLVVLALGWTGDWFGKTDMGDVYPSDAVSYLDCARAFGRGDFTSALNPLWNQGYPALLALGRPLFRSGPEGVWYATHTLNLIIYFVSWCIFAWLVRELVLLRRGDTDAEDRRGAGPVVGFGAACLFITAQLCIDQVSRVGPDKLVALLFYLACALLLRLFRRPGFGLAVLLGLALGLGYLTKSAFLPLGCVVLVIVAIRLRRRGLVTAVPAALVFSVIVLGYGIALSHAVGWPTLGESGTLNYAWHVNRLEKWVHWEGGTLPSVQAWPSPRLARLTHWESDPPDFGVPLHPSQRVGSAPTIYEFRGTRHATYDPYYDPPYWYRGYNHLFRWRYQAISLAKNGGHLLQAVAVQPTFWALGAVALLGLWAKDERRRFRAWIRQVWPLAVSAAAGALIYVPVHLEDRYISAFLAVLALLVLIGVAPAFSGRKQTAVLALLALGFGVGLVRDQRAGWADALHGVTHEQNLKWKIGTAVLNAGLPRGSEVGVIFWGANLDSDWANIGEVEITSEIASGPDEKAFWALPPAGQTQVLERFHQAGAVAVLTRDHPQGTAAGWRRLGDAPMWMYRF